MIPNPDDVTAITEALDRLYATYDGRVVTATLGVRAARGYQTLRVIGIETAESTGRIYGYLLGLSLEKPEQAPKVIYQSDTPEGMQ